MNAKILLVSTHDDPSLALFANKEAALLIEPHVITYDMAPSSILKLLNQDFSHVYFRDPFNDSSISQQDVRNVVDIVSDRLQSSCFVDGVTTYDDILFEDKWRQYRALSAYMPHTELLQSLRAPDRESEFIKERISSRARGIIFKERDFPSGAMANDYIVQQKLDIHTEYRIFMVGGVIIQPMAIKSSLTTTQKVKVVGIADSIAPELAAICDAVYRATAYDLIGLDVAETDDGYFLLEVNRSCQFGVYSEKSSINLARALDEYLLMQI